MYLKEIKEAKEEAQRFLKRIKELENRLKTQSWCVREFRGELYVEGIRETASIKRASMDLTNVLADLRKSKY